MISVHQRHAGQTERQTTYDESKTEICTCLIIHRIFITRGCDAMFTF